MVMRVFYTKFAIITPEILVFLQTQPSFLIARFLNTAGVLYCRRKVCAAYRPVDTAVCTAVREALASFSSRIRRCLSHPSGAFSKLDFSTTKRVANTERYVFGKLSARCFRHRPFRHRHYSNCGDIGHGKSGHGGVIYTVVYGIAS